MRLHVYGYGALIVVIGALYVWSSLLGARIETRNAQIERYKADVVTLQGDADRAREAATANAQAVKDIQADLDRQAEIAYRFEDEARQSNVKLKAALRRIADAPSADDGPVAPILARELDGLRRDYAAASAGHGSAPRADQRPAQ